MDCRVLIIYLDDNICLFISMYDKGYDEGEVQWSLEESISLAQLLLTHYTMFL